MIRTAALARGLVIYCALSLLLIGCGRVDPVLTPHLNTSAALPPGLPLDPTQWRVLSSSADNRAGTMSILFGDDQAFSSIGSNPSQREPLHGTMAFVTWRQQDDARWFGGRIPSNLVSVELIRLKGADVEGDSFEYQLYTGNPLRAVAQAHAEDANRRARSILMDPVALFP